MSDEYTKAMKIANSRNKCHTKESIELLKRGASSGDLSCMYEYGKALYDGNGINCDCDEAARLWELASQRGSIDALLGIGDCYLFGNGKPEDNEQAYRIYQEVYRREPSKLYALTQIGRMHFNGWGVDEDKDKGISIYKKAWKKGYARAGADLGAIYLYDMDGSLDSIRTGLDWCQRAADFGDEKACSMLGHIFANGDYGIPKDNALAYKFLKKARSDSNAIGTLIETKCFGFCSDIEYQELLDEALERAGQGASRIQLALGEVYAEGKHMPRDITKAEKWYGEALENGYESVGNLLGYRYRYGFDGFPVDLNKAIYYYTKSAESGDVDGMYALAELYDSFTVKLDNISDQERKQRALYWYEKAAKEGHDLSARILAAKYNK